VKAIKNDSDSDSDEQKKVVDIVTRQISNAWYA